MEGNVYLFFGGGGPPDGNRFEGQLTQVVKCLITHIFILKLFF